MAIMQGSFAHLVVGAIIVGVFASLLSGMLDCLASLRASLVYVKTELWEDYGSICTLEQSNHGESFFGSEVADGSNHVE
jgi:hypothetical protein